MEGNSAQTFVSKFKQIELFLREVFESPRKSTIFILAVSILLSFLLFGIFQIKQNLAVDSQIKTQFEEKKRKEQQEQTSNKQTTEENLSYQDETRKRDLNNIKSKLEAFYQTKGFYPSSLINLTPTYLSRVPLDPQTNREYYYLCQLDQRGYILRTDLSDASVIELENN